MTTTEAFGAWGAYDRDEPFPLFAAARELGTVHAVTLADGHEAWLVVGYEEARIALNDPRLSKDMHAALATGAGVVAEGLPGPSFARHMLSVDPPDHSRLRRLVSTAFTPRHVEQLRPRVQAIADDLLDEIAAAGPNVLIDLVSAFAFPLPFTVICELLGVPDPDRAALGRGLTALLAPTPTIAEYERARAASDAVVAMLEALVEGKQASPGDDLVKHPGAAVDDLPADRGRARHDREPHRQQCRRSAPASRSARRAAVRSRQADRRRRGTASLRRTGSPLDISLLGRADGHR